MHLEQTLTGIDIVVIANRNFFHGRRSAAMQFSSHIYKCSYAFYTFFPDIDRMYRYTFSQPPVFLFFQSNYFDFNRKFTGKLLYRYTGAGRFVSGKISLVNFIHCPKVSHISKVH